MTDGSAGQTRPSYDPDETGLPVDLLIDVDCENAPRKAQVRDLLIALSDRRVEDVAAELATDVEWDVVGSGAHRGRDDVARATVRRASRLHHPHRA